MKHGVAFRKLSRTSSHRMLMLRNLVSSLLEHQQIKTTLPKAKETARLAEKILTLGKRGDLPAQREAASFLLNGHKTLTPLFGEYAERYRDRPGGYTRIHKFGHRKGDHAPHAIVELCDGPRDIRFELTARAVGRETVQRWLQTQGQAAADQAEYSNIADRPWIRETTRTNYTQLMKYASEERKKEFESKAIDWANHLLADAKLNGGLRRPAAPDPDAKKVITGITVRHVGRRHNAGERLTGMSEKASTLGIAAGVVGKGKSSAPPSRPVANVGINSNNDRTSIPRQSPSAPPRVWRSQFWEGGWKEAVARKATSEQTAR